MPTGELLTNITTFAYYRMDRELPCLERECTRCHVRHTIAVGSHTLTENDRFDEFYHSPLSLCGTTQLESSTCLCVTLMSIMTILSIDYAYPRMTVKHMRTHPRSTASSHEHDAFPCIKDQVPPAPSHPLHQFVI